ncbi:hypothetical protein J2T55_001457 [Methylohalomonas lacus]|uniref:Uncharacterized protein n=1 Tax=Methylohalomonas lacus TaxID=398773 RepID=A0AAE3HLR0_9GAMM|nr:hypothetical protein [Methylohalomonas lacus]MCS3903436.1 hypothetical protein [Methylohalomonas lacus]
MQNCHADGRLIEITIIGVQRRHDDGSVLFSRTSFTAKGDKT